MVYSGTKILKSQIGEKILYFPLEISVSSIIQEYDNVTTPYYLISAQQPPVHWSLVAKETVVAYRRLQI